MSSKSSSVADICGEAVDQVIRHAAYTKSLDNLTEGGLLGLTTKKILISGSSSLASSASGNCQSFRVIY